MSKAFTGGCACGAVRYEVTGEPIATNDCHCRQCQRDSGTGHGSYLTFSRAAATVVGHAKTFELVGDGGTVKARAFCPNCGTPVYMSFPAMPDLIVVRAGSLDEPERYRVGQVLWASAAPTWDVVAPNVPVFEKMPTS